MSGTGEIPEDQPSIAVFGVYKSGTTALHYRIHNALGEGVREIFEPTLYRRNASDRRTGVLAKVIVRPSGPRAPRIDYQTFATFDYRLLLLRDPRDWLVSVMLFTPQQRLSDLSPGALARQIDALRRKEDDPGGVPFLPVLRLLTAGSGSAALSHLQALRDIRGRLEGALEVRYEDMVAGRLREAEHYLGLPLAAEPRIPDHFSHVPRTRGSGGWRDWFCPSDVEQLRPRLDPFLEDFGYDTSDWELNTSQEIDPEHASGYVERTIAKRRRGRVAG